MVEDMLNSLFDGALGENGLFWVIIIIVLFFVLGGWNW